MHRYGHVGAALLAYAPLAFAALLAGFEQVAVVGAVAAAALSMLPDYDQRVPLVDHRGPTHTVWFAVLVGALCGVGGVVVGLDAGRLAGVGLGVFGFVAGALVICSHIAADALTPMGVRPYSPWSNRKITYNLARADNPLANYALLALGLLAAGLAFVAADGVRQLLG